MKRYKTFYNILLRFIYWLETNGRIKTFILKKAAIFEKEVILKYL
jgi:hypothetical protein